MQKITPCLWFDSNCEEAVNFYTSLFPNSKISSIKRYPPELNEGPMKGMAGKVLTAVFTLDGLEFQALDGGPIFKKNPSVSFFVNFDPSRESEAKDRLNAMWAKLSEGGKVLMPLQEYPFSKHYGWVEDRFGLSWQLILTDPNGEPRPSLVPSLLFVKEVAGKAEEAINYYMSVFKDGKMGTIARYPAGMEPDKEGSILYADFELFSQWFAAMDSAQKHEFKFNEGISFAVDCKDQAEVDYYWDTFTKDKGGQESECGWLKDKYGFSWQIVPTRLGELLSDPDQAKSNRALQAMLGMKKLVIADLEKAFNG